MKWNDFRKAQCGARGPAVGQFLRARWITTFHCKSLRIGGHRLQNARGQHSDGGRRLRQQNAR